jgi:hypothetical protein
VLAGFDPNGIRRGAFARADPGIGYSSMKRAGRLSALTF